MFDDHHAIGDRLREMQVLFGQQHRQPLCLELQDHTGHLFDDHRRDAFGGFVQQDERGVAHQGAGDGQHLLLAPRQRLAAVVTAFGEVGE